MLFSCFIKIDKPLTEVWLLDCYCDWENKGRIKWEERQKCPSSCVCALVPERKVRGLLCSVFYCSTACHRARLLIAVAVVGGAAGAARHPAAVSREAGSQGRSWSPPQGPWSEQTVTSFFWHCTPEAPSATANLPSLPFPEPTFSSHLSP